MIVPLAFASSILQSMPAVASAGPFAKPDLVLRQIAEGMPNGTGQKVRIMTATFKPSDKTVHHTRRFPATVYVLKDEFTLELAGRAPIVSSISLPKERNNQKLEIENKNDCCNEPRYCGNRSGGCKFTRLLLVGHKFDKGDYWVLSIQLPFALGLL
jgi:hypothetical protein